MLDGPVHDGLVLDEPVRQQQRPGRCASSRSRPAAVSPVLDGLVRQQQQEPFGRGLDGPVLDGPGAAAPAAAR
jgi:hypothetical protein